MIDPLDFSLTDLLYQTDVWVTRDERVLNLPEIPLDHLNNILLWIERCADSYWQRVALEAMFAQIERHMNSEPGIDPGIDWPESFNNTLEWVRSTPLFCRLNEIYQAAI